MIHGGREGGRVTVLPVLNQRRVGEQEEEEGKEKKTRRNTGVEGGGTRRQLNTTVDEAARPRSRDGLRSPQCAVSAWMWCWLGGGISGVGG